MLVGDDAWYLDARYVIHSAHSLTETKEKGTRKKRTVALNPVMRDEGWEMGEMGDDGPQLPDSRLPGLGTATRWQSRSCPHGIHGIMADGAPMP